MPPLTSSPFGGVNVIHFFAVNPMSHPLYGVPRQHPSTRRIEKGDVISTEITANFWDYGGQVLRTFSVGEELNPLFRDLHAAAQHYAVQQRHYLASGALLLGAPSAATIAL